mgnify:CR=1 FL=1
MMKHEFKLQWGLPLTGGVAHEMALRPLTIGGELAAKAQALGAQAARQGRFCAPGLARAVSRPLSGRVKFRPETKDRQ